MNFRVDPVGIEGYGGLVDRAAEDTVAAIRYLGNAKLDHKGIAGQFWEQLSQEHDKYVGDGKVILEKIQGVLEASARELASSARYYRETDHDEAAKLDATYPCSQGKKTRGSPGSPGDFADARDASGALKPPGGDSGYLGGHVDEYNFSLVSKSIGTAMDLGSPSALANEALKLIFDFDLFGTVVKWVAGDWDSYTECGEAWANLGSFCSAVAENLEKGNDLLETSWNGNAADAAWVYFDVLSLKIGEVEQGFTSLRRNYDSIARAIFAFAEFLKAFLADVCDRAIVWMITTAAAAAATATGVGAFAGAASAALAAAQLLQIVRRWDEAVTGLTGTAQVLNGVLLASSAGMAATFASVKDFPATGSSYDHRAV